MNNTGTERNEMAGRSAVKLSRRLKQVADFVKPGSWIADIGTDHGFVPVYLAQTGRVGRALAMDVRRGPLERAQAHIREYRAWAGDQGLEACSIETRLSDGLRGLSPGEADTVIMAGMGGELEIRILEEGRHVWDSVGHWILSPQSDLDKVRHYLGDNGFAIVDEAMVKEDGKFYTVISAVRGPMHYRRQIEYLYGAILIGRRDPVLREYLDREQRRVLGIRRKLEEGGLTPMTESRSRALEAIDRELLWIEEAQDEMR